ncbi:MAG TPA: CheR family methyltransferase [Terriglobia bacterium]|nr:CheR family methyltransferase [Terriglobia bacterium]
MAALKISRLEDYLQYLAVNPEETDAVGRDIRASLSSFFRDAKSFESLKRGVFPKLLKRKTAEESIRIWVAGCPAGQEAYSVAICLAECLEELSAKPRIQIFATDSDQINVEEARAGFYSERIAAEVSPQRLQRFFVKSEGAYQVVKPIRDLCIFAQHDLMQDPPFSKLDLICCRNILTYLKPAARQEIIRTFYYALRPEGYLLLGRSEEIKEASEAFLRINRERRTYQRKPAKANLSFRAPLTSAGQQKSHRTYAANQWWRVGLDLQREASRILSRRYAPPAVIIDSDFQVKHFLGQTGLYLEPAQGRASLDLPRMLRDDLAGVLRAMVQQARTGGKPVRQPARTIESDGDASWVNLEVVPLSRGDEESRYFLVIFELAGNCVPESLRPAEKPLAKGLSGPRVRKGHRSNGLRLELDNMRRNLQVAMKEQLDKKEELRAANDGILAANEDLQSANEELETAKEELQSANEELTILNQELQSRNAELAAAGNDLENLLRTVDVVLLLDRELRVRRVSPAAARAFAMMPSDAGRNIADIQQRLELPDVQNIVTETLETAAPYDREIRNKEGRWYRLRIRPYKTGDGRIAGAVVLLTDIDALKSKLVADEQEKARLEAEARNKYQRFFEHSLAAKFIATPQGMILDCNDAFVRLSGGVSRERVLESSFQALCADSSRWNDLVKRLNSEEYISEHEADLARKDGTIARVLMNVGLAKGGDSTVVEGSILDITGPRQAQRTLREVTRRLAEIQDEERQRFGRQLHDVVGSALVALNMNLAAAQKTPTDGNAGSAVSEALALGKDVLQQVRTLSYLLHPPLMHELGSNLALRLYVEGFSQRAGIDVQLEISAEIHKLPSTLEMTLFRILQETLSNVHRHSGSRTAAVRLGKSQGVITLEVSDQGKGINLAPSHNGSANPGLGLAIVKERAESAGGQFNIKSVPGRGTSIYVVLPLQEPAP